LRTVYYNILRDSRQTPKKSVSILMQFTAFPLTAMLMGYNKS